MEAAYLRRLRFEARVVATAILEAQVGVDEQVGRRGGAGGVVTGRSGRRYERVSSAAMVGQLGGLIGAPETGA